MKTYLVTGEVTVQFGLKQRIGLKLKQQLHNESRSISMMNILKWSEDHAMWR